MTVITLIGALEYSEVYKSDSAASNVIYRGQWKYRLAPLQSFSRITHCPDVPHWLIGKMSSSSRLLILTPNGIKDSAGHSAKGTRATQPSQKLYHLLNTLQNNIIQLWHIISPCWRLSRHVFQWRLRFRDCRSQERTAVLSHSIDYSLCCRCCCSSCCCAQVLCSLKNNLTIRSI